jgi:hypothetical protein
MKMYFIRFLYAFLFFGICFVTEISAQNVPSDNAYYVANTMPPDDYLALRTLPIGSAGQRITIMRNGTRLQLIQKLPNGWWQVKITETGQVGWAMSGSGNKQWIVCCAQESETPSKQALDSKGTQKQQEGDGNNKNKETESQVEPSNGQGKPGQTYYVSLFPPYESMGFRFQPAKQGQLIKALQNGDSLIFISKAESDYWRVKYPKTGAEGYVLSIIDGKPLLSPTPLTSKELQTYNKQIQTAQVERGENENAKGSGFNTPTDLKFANELVLLNIFQGNGSVLLKQAEIDELKRIGVTNSSLAREAVSRMGWDNKFALPHVADLTSFVDKEASRNAEDKVAAEKLMIANQAGFKTAVDFEISKLLGGAVNQGSVNLLKQRDINTPEDLKKIQTRFKGKTESSKPSAEEIIAFLVSEELLAAELKANNDKIAAEKELRDLDIIVLFDSRSQSKVIERNINGDIEISGNPNGQDICFAGELFFPDRYSFSPNPNISKYGKGEYFTFFLQAIKQKFPAVNFQAPTSSIDCNYIIHTNPNTADFKSKLPNDQRSYFRALSFIQRNELSGALPSEVQEIYTISWKDFIDQQGRRAAERVAALELSKSRINQILEGTIRGAGLISIAGLETSKLVNACTVQEENGLWIALFQATKNAAYRNFHAVLKGNLIPSDINSAFKSLKDGDCGYIIGKAGSLKTVITALSREGKAIVLDDNWLAENIVNDLEAQFEALKKAHEEAKKAELAAAEAKRIEDERCNADNSCRAKRQAQADAIAAAERAKRPPFRAIISCRINSNIVMPFYCFQDSSRHVGGSLTIMNDNVERAYTPYEIFNLMQQAPYQLDLSEHFKILAQANADSANVLEIKIIDRDDNVKFQKQATRLESINVAN